MSARVDCHNAVGPSLRAGKAVHKLGDRAYALGRSGVTRRLRYWADMSVEPRS
jgi:hypothetical protein